MEWNVVECHTTVKVLKPKVAYSNKTKEKVRSIYKGNKCAGKTYDGACSSKCLNTNIMFSIANTCLLVGVKSPEA